MCEFCRDLAAESAFPTVIYSTNRCSWDVAYYLKHVNLPNRTPPSLAHCQFFQENVMTL